jgi:hypothetical protein
MNAYAYQEVMLCEGCAHEEERFIAVNRPDRVGAEDSGDYPQGPYADGGGEADTPQHCDCCGVFLENPLTSDGREYVIEQLVTYRSRPVLDRWREFYGITAEELAP